MTLAGIIRGFRLARSNGGFGDYFGVRQHELRVLATMGNRVGIRVDHDHGSERIASVRFRRVEFQS